MYFTDSELISFCKAIHKLLSEFGGIWMTADAAPMNQIYPLTLGVLYKGDQEKFYPSMQKASSSMADVHSHTNTLAANRFESLWSGKVVCAC
jgi:hypothetical protein